MKRPLALGGVLLFVAAACATGPSGTPPPGTGTPQPTPSATSSEPVPTPTDRVLSETARPRVEHEIEPFDPTDFSDPASVTNTWLPLTPGTRWIYEGIATIEGTVLTRRVVLVITDMTKVISGINTVVGYETDFTNGVLTESELAFWAQDDGGTVWRIGEYPEVYEEGQLIETPVWMHGYEDAAAGISMRPDPEPWTPSYAQGWGPEVGWNDRGRVFEVGSETCVPFDCYTDVQIIAEFSVDEPDVYQLKYYSRGTGLVRVGWAGAREEEREELELTSFEQLSAAEMDLVRAETLAQDARGVVYNEIYAQLASLVQRAN